MSRYRLLAIPQGVKLKLKAITLAAIIACGQAYAFDLSETGVDQNSITSRGGEIFDSKGRTAYLIKVKTDFTTEAFDNSFPKPVKILAETKTNAAHTQKGRAALALLKSKYNIQATLVTSWTETVAYAYLSPNDVKLLSADPSVASLSKDKNLTEFVDTDFSKVQLTPEFKTQSNLTTQSSSIPFLPGYSNSSSNNEITPWGISATNTNTVVPANVPVFMLDYQLPYYTYQFWVYEKLLYNPANSYGTHYNQYHPVAVAGIMGAAINGVQTRGINPGSPIIAVNAGTINSITEASIAAAFEASLVHSEQNGNFPTLNISINSQNAYAEFHSRSSIVQKAMLRASNRIFIAQSAGNKVADRSGDACAYAFNSKNPLDGIMVVGGYDVYGKLASVTSDDGSSNKGLCVDVWGPGQDVWVEGYPNVYGEYQNHGDFQGTLPIHMRGGTSFASPYVAAIAARYGDGLSRPPVRESYIQQSVRPTGQSDGFQAIQSVTYDPAVSGVLQLLPVINTWSLQSSTNLSTLTDGNFLNAFWNAGGYSGAVVFELSNNPVVSGFRISPRRDQDGQATYKILVSNDGYNYTQAGVIDSNFASNLVPESGKLSTPTRARFVKIEGVSQNSWLALAEVEFYGNQ